MQVCLLSLFLLEMSAPSPLKTNPLVVPSCPVSCATRALAAPRRSPSGQISFVEIYNEQLFDLLQPEVCPAQRRFSVYGRNESAVGKRSAASAHVPEEHTGGGGSRSSSRENTPQQPDLAIYERPDGSTYVKV